MFMAAGAEVEAPSRCVGFAPRGFGGGGCPRLEQGQSVRSPGPEEEELQRQGGRN